MQGGDSVSTMRVSESEGRLESLTTAGTPSGKNSSAGAISGGPSGNRGGSAKSWQYR